MRNRLLFDQQKIVHLGWADSGIVHNSDNSELYLFFSGIHFQWHGYVLAVSCAFQSECYISVVKHNITNLFFVIIVRYF